MKVCEGESVEGEGVCIKVRVCECDGMVYEGMFEGEGAQQTLHSQ